MTDDRSRTATEARLRPLARALRRAARRRRHVSWSRAEEDAALLAARLREALPAADLAAARFRGVPRGGLVVVAMLAYHLGVTHERLRDDGDGDGAVTGGPLVLVDDCALSGLRLHQEVARLADEPRLVVAHLYSPRELREAVLAAEPRVEACVAAHDLADLSAEVYPDGEEREAWRQRWRQRLGDDGRYWLGMPAPVAFAWGEPDRPFWNPVTGAVEDGWRFEPPHRSLKSRARLAAGLPDGVVGPAAPRSAWHLADGVVWGEFDGVVWLCAPGDETAGDGEVFSLDGSAALAWRGLVVGGVETASAALAAHFEIDPGTARRDAEALAAELAAAGLLTSPAAEEV
ncbi:MAG TPA: PqqD family protein [Thermoanaerobaculia bacterium]|nr:PqqD family protein [Thermoanaerobaculia bacterium]